MSLKFKYIYLLIAFLLLPYELIFYSLVNRFNFLNFITKGRSYDYEPFPLNFIADFQYDILYNTKYSWVLYFLPLFFLWVNTQVIKENKNKLKGDLFDFISSYLPYFVLNYIFYRTYYFYCKFSKPIETVSLCEQTDNYFYFSILFLSVYFVIFKPNYLVKNLKSTFFIILLFFTFNLSGSGYLGNFPGVYVHYQDLFSLETIFVFLLLIILHKYLKEDIFVLRSIVLLLSTALYFKSIFFVILLVASLIIFKELKYKILQIYEFIFAIYLIISISFSSLTYGGNWDSLDLINEFYSFALTPSLIDYFPQYNYLLPIILKPIILSFNDVIFQFNLLMGSITLFSLGLILRLLQKLSTNNFLLYVVVFFGFGFNFYSIGNQLTPTNLDLINGNVESLVNIFQTIPLRIYMYSIFIFIFVKHLMNKHNKKLKLFISCILVFALLDNPFVGLSLTISYLSYEFITNFGFLKLRNFINNFWPILLLNITFVLFIFFNQEFKHLYLFINSTGFTDAWFLQFHYFGFHIFALFINLFIFIFCIQQINSSLSEDLQTKVEFLLFNTIFVFVYFVYFVGRSHPENLFVVLIPFLINVLIFFEVNKENKKINVINIVFLLIFSSGIIQMRYTPSIIDYIDNIYVNEINLEFLNLEVNGERSDNIIVNPVLDNHIVEKVDNKNLIVFSRFGSIVSHLNSLNGFTPLISNVIFSEFQCSKVLKIIKKPNYEFVLISKDPYVTQSYYTSCFKEHISSLLENEDHFNLIFEDVNYRLFKKNDY